jgi:hypothetical protein
MSALRKREPFAGREMLGKKREARAAKREVGLCKQAEAMARQAQRSAQEKAAAAQAQASAKAVAAEAQASRDAAKQARIDAVQQRIDAVKELATSPDVLAELEEGETLLGVFAHENKLQTKFKPVIVTSLRVIGPKGSAFFSRIRGARLERGWGKNPRDHLELVLDNGDRFDFGLLQRPEAQEAVKLINRHLARREQRREQQLMEGE